jgi:hypothetical protein
LLLLLLLLLLLHLTPFQGALPPSSPLDSSPFPPAALLSLLLLLLLLEGQLPPHLLSPLMLLLLPLLVGMLNQGLPAQHCFWFHVPASCHHPHQACKI